MRISTKLWLAVYIPALLALILIVALVISYLQMRTIQENGDIVRRIRSSITELNHSVFSYILYHEERPKEQFLSEHDTALGLIDSAQISSPDQQKLLDSIRQNCEAMKDSFLQLVALNESSNTGSASEHQAAEDRLSGLLLLQSYEADSTASVLRSLVDNGIRTTEEMTTGLIFLVLVLATIPLTFVLAQTRRSIVSSLSKLVKGTGIIGSGNLDYRIETKANDEIGDLSRAFNRMTVDLKTVTASKADLEREIAERLKAEEGLRQRTIELENANKELEAFNYSVSHDLRQPLRALDGFSLAVVENIGDRLDETNREYLNRVRKASQTMGLLIDDLLKLSRINRAEMILDKVNLSEVVCSISEELRQREPGRQAEFIIKPDIMVRGDRPLLTIALRNILENAWKFTRKCAQTRIEVGTAQVNGDIVYLIKDNGAGFDMKYYDKLFQPFQRLHDSKDYEGTGIGLATVQRVIRRHGGKVWAESEIDKGTTVYFTIGS